MINESITNPVPMSAIGGLSHSVLQRIVGQRQIAVLTHYRAPTAILAPWPRDETDTASVLALCRAALDGDEAVTVRGLNTEWRDAAWRGEVVPITLGRDSRPCAVVLPFDATAPDKYQGLLLTG
jgi:hypothetical protein